MGLLTNFYYNHILLRSLGWLFFELEVRRYGTVTITLTTASAPVITSSIEGTDDATAATARKKTHRKYMRANKSIRNFLITEWEFS